MYHASGFENAAHEDFNRLRSLVSQAVTEHHVLVLFPHKLVALNTVSRQAVQQLPLTGRSAIGNPVGLAADATTGAVYLYTGALGLVAEHAAMAVKPS
jgi:Pep3/Vps18/deep orange family